MSNENSVPETVARRDGLLKRLGRRLISLTTFSINLGIAAAAVMEKGGSAWHSHPLGVFVN